LPSMPAVRSPSTTRANAASCRGFSANPRLSEGC
jgi:hypothetical protein